MVTVYVVLGIKNCFLHKKKKVEQGQKIAEPYKNPISLNLIRTGRYTPEVSSYTVVNMACGLACKQPAGCSYRLINYIIWQNNYLQE